MVPTLEGNEFLSQALFDTSPTNQKEKHGNVVYKDKQSTWEDRSRPGVFAGYEMKPGYEWSGRYLVWDLDAFQNANLFATTKKCMVNHNDPHGVMRIRMPVEGIRFPLKEACLKANDTLEGRTAKGAPAADDHGAADAPPLAPPVGNPLFAPLGDAPAGRDREDADAEGDERRVR